MRPKSKIRLLVAETAAVAINIIPLGLWLFEDYSAETTMVIYALESAASIVLGGLCVAIISPSHDPDGTPKYKRKNRLIADFTVLSGAMLLACGVFLSAFIFLVLKASVDLRLVGAAFGIVVVFQVIEFFVNLVTLRPLPLRKAEFLLTRSMGKAALLFLGIFMGFFLAGFVDEWFVVPFIALKSIVDIAEPIQFFLGKQEIGVPFEAG